MHRLIKKLNSREAMVRTRTPCCDQTGVKKGAWTPEEDRKLIAYVTRYGHWNWRLLPKFAGLARSGKSCRLRWMNYLRPDVKRGSYTREEEDTIIRLHEELGNRWSMIAAHLPGRTDNQIKNHWHTNLKKRFLHNSKDNNKSRQDSDTGPSKYASANSRISNTCPMSSQASSGKFSSITTSSLNENLVVEDDLAFLDANFWTEPFMVDISYVPSEAPVISLVTEPEYYSPVCDISNDHLYPKDDFAFLDAFAEPEPMSTNFLTEPHMVDISSDPSETLVPMMSEPEYFSPLCDATKEKYFLDAFTEPVSANCLAEPYAPNEAVVPLMSESECFSSVWNANNENLFLEEAFTNPMGANFSTEPYMVDISNVPSECDANKENLFVEGGCFSTFWDA